MGLDGVEIILEIEDKFRVRLPVDGCSRCRTVADLAGLTTAIVNQAKAPHPPTSPVQSHPEVLSAKIDPRIYERVREIVARQGPVTLERVQPTSRLKEDLGLD